jgi:glucokinase
VKIYLPHIINASQMRRVNRAAILELIRQAGPIARSEIARKLGLSQPTVMRIVDELLEKEMVRYNGETEASRGRRRDLLEYFNDGHAVIGIDLGGTKMFGALANIGGEIQAELTVDGHGTQEEASFELLADMIERLLRFPLKDGQKYSGIAVGAPGVTNPVSGVIKWAPSLKWRDYPLKEKLEYRFDLPCFVDNDVNLAALGEYWFGAGRGCRNMVLMAIGTGLGAGLILDGALYRGNTESAGEVGYLVSSPKDLDQVYDEFGAMELHVSGTGVANRAREYLQGKVSEIELAEISSQHVFTAARQQEEWALEILSDVVDDLSIAIVNISTILDPEVVILGGGVAREADLLISAVQKRLKGVIPNVPKIVPSPLGRKAAVMGAIVLVLQETNEYYVLKKLS